MKPEINMPRIEIPYEDTFLKDLADDVKAGQDETAKKIDALREENRRSGRQAFLIAVASLIVSTLTLLATVLFGLLR